jgi:hypothetical protein
MFSQPRECYVLTHWRVLDNGALLVCSQSLTNKEDSIVPLPGDGTSRGYVRASLGLEGWIASPMPRGSDGKPASNLVYVVEGEGGSRTPWWNPWKAERMENQPLRVSKLIQTLTADPEMLDRYATSPPLRNES